MIIQVTCKKCGQVVNLEYEPNEFISENFIRNAFVCEDCKKTPFQRKLDASKPARPQASASLPYKDS